jgi:hypothetical protein
MAAAFSVFLICACGEGPSPIAETFGDAVTSGGVTATLVITNQWSTGYQADIHLSNSGPTTTAWTTVVNLNGTTFANGWNAALAANSTQVTASNLSYNAAIPKADTAVWGFQGSRANGSTALPTLASVSIASAAGTGGSGAGGSGAGGAGGSARTGTGGAGTGGAVAGGTGGATSPPPPTGGAGPAANITGSTCANFGVLRDANYVVMNNVFNDAAGSQCVSGTGPGFKVTTSNHNVATNGAPASYVAFVRGCHFGTCSTSSGNIPKQVSAITSAPSSFSVTPPSGNWDASYDIWFNTSMPSASTGRNNGLEMMIWLNSNGVQPIGSRTATATIGGLTYEVWNGSASPNVISYRRSPTATSTPANFDIKLFMNDAVSRGVLQSSWWLSSIQAGFEIWGGGVNATVNGFTAAVN